MKCSCCGKETSSDYMLANEVLKDTKTEYIGNNTNRTTSTYATYTQNIPLCGECIIHREKNLTYDKKDKLLTIVISVILFFAITLFGFAPSWIFTLLRIKVEHTFIWEIIFFLPIIILVFFIVKTVRYFLFITWTKRNKNHSSIFGKYFIDDKGNLQEKQMDIIKRYKKIIYFLLVYIPIMLLFYWLT